jgi:hypothetical protein
VAECESHHVGVRIVHHSCDRKSSFFTPSASTGGRHGSIGCRSASSHDAEPKDINAGPKSFYFLCSIEIQTLINHACRLPLRLWRPLELVLLCGWPVCLLSLLIFARSCYRYILRDHLRKLHLLFQHRLTSNYSPHILLLDLSHDICSSRTST